MAQSLTSLIKHFDLCVTAVRATDGGADLARRKVAEVAHSQGVDAAAGGGGDGVSLSNIIAEQESQVSDLEPKTAEDRLEIARVVVEDSAIVEEVVGEINERLEQVEADAASLHEQANHIRASFLGTLAAFRVLEDIGSRVPGYVAAEGEFLQRWDDEKEVIISKVEEMESLREIYEQYIVAYRALTGEVERRHGVEDRIQTVWRKARDAVDKLVEADRAEREVFRQESGQFLPNDLWLGINDPLTRWDVVPVYEEGEKEKEKGRA
jgi:autophagy-related protein 17